MIGAEEFFAGEFGDVAEFPVYVSDDAAAVGDGDDGMRIERFFIFLEEAEVGRSGFRVGSGAAFQLARVVEELRMAHLGWVAVGHSRRR
jgi:hypothetical protein